MKKAKRWRYYCDYCKKVGGHAGVMKSHEKYCTMNPERQCRMCDIADACTDTKELVNLVQTFQSEGDVICEDGAMDKLHDKADSCPACILAALRQSGLFLPEFNFKDAVNAMWVNHDDSC